MAETILAALVWIMLSGALTSGAHAASFDCTKAKSPFELAICSDPELSKSDEKMSADYSSAMKELSPSGQDAMRNSQRAFLKYLNVLCDPSGPIKLETDMPISRAIINCLRDQYRDRERSLAEAVIPLGGKVFYTTVSYRIRIALVDNEDGNDDSQKVPFAVTELGEYLQIDSPKSPAEITWNAFARKEVTQALLESRTFGDTPNATFENDDRDDVDVRLLLISASPDLIVSSINASLEWSGAAHPHDFGDHTTSWSLKLNRLLTAEDIFDSRKTWRPKLEILTQSHLKPEDADVLVTAKVHDVDNINRWLIQPNGLHVTYGPYELGGYLSSADAKLSWQELAPYLRKDMPFDPQKIQVSSWGSIY